MANHWIYTPCSSPSSHLFTAPLPSNDTFGARCWSVAALAIDLESSAAEHNAAQSRLEAIEARNQELLERVASLEGQLDHAQEQSSAVQRIADEDSQAWRKKFDAQAVAYEGRIQDLQTEVRCACVNM